MERSHSASSGSTHRDDSWTCQRCGWVYPNAHPSAKHRRNHRKQCGKKIKGSMLQSEHKGGSSDEASSDDESLVKREDLPHLPPQSPQTQHDGIRPIEAGSAVPAVEHPSASKDLPVTEANVSDKIMPDTPILQGISASGDIKPEVPDPESTRNLINMDVIESESPAPELVPNTCSLDKTSKTSGEEKVMHAALVDRVEVPAHVLPGLDIEEAKDSVEQTVKFEGAPIELTREIPLKTSEGHGRLGHASIVDGVEVVARDTTGLDYDVASSAYKKDAKSEGSAPEHTQIIPSLDEPSSTLQEHSKVSLTPYVDKVEIAAQESRGLNSEQATELHKNESSPISKEHVLNRQGSSQEKDSWTCNRCGWVYPNPHPSAKHRRNHRKQCGKIKGYELPTEPHKGGSSDDVSSDEEINVKKEDLQYQSPQILIAKDQSYNTAATGSTRPGVDHPATFVEGKSRTESGSRNLLSRDLSASKENAPDKELSDVPNLEAISAPDIKSSDAAPNVSHNMASLAQQNPPLEENKKGAAVLDQITVVPCDSNGLDASQTKELPKHSSLKEEPLPNPANVQENLGSPETQLNTVPCVGRPETQLNRVSYLGSPVTQLNEVPSLPRSVDASASEGLDDLVKDTLVVEHGSTNKLAESPDGLSGDPTPHIASIPSVSYSLSSDASTPAYVEDKDASILKVDEPTAVVISAMDSRAFGSSDETLAASVGAGLNHSVILKEGTDVSKKQGLVGLDGTSNFKNLDALDDMMVHDPQRRETVEMTGGMEGRDGLLSPDKILSDLSPITLAADKVPVENTVKENPLPAMVSSTADVTGLEDDAEEGRSHSVQASVNPAELIPKKELLSEIVEGDNDDEFSSRIEKVDETPPVTNMLAQSLEKQGTSAGVDVSKEVRTPADATGEAKSIQEMLDIPSYVASENIFPDSENFCQGKAQLSGGNTDITNTKISTAKDSDLSDIVKESEAEGISSVKDGHHVKTAEAGDARNVMKQPEAKEDTPRETTGIESSYLNYTETSTGPEIGVARSEVGSSAHKLSDSLEIYEDAPDSLETCSVGGSVEDNESWDEPRQASDVMPEEPKNVSLDERVSGVCAGPDEKSNVLNGSSVGEASSEGKATSLPYAVRSEMEDLKAPSPEAWQEPGPSTVKSEGKKISTSEVTEDGRSGESHTALRNLMAKEGPEKADQIAESITAAGDLKSSNKTEDSLASGNGTKPKSRSFWSHCICCPTVH